MYSLQGSKEITENVYYFSLIFDESILLDLLQLLREKHVL